MTFDRWTALAGVTHAQVKYGNKPDENKSTNYVTSSTCTRTLRVSYIARDRTDIHSWWNIVPLASPSIKTRSITLWCSAPGLKRLSVSNSQCHEDHNSARGLKVTMHSVWWLMGTEETKSQAYLDPAANAQSSGMLLPLVWVREGVVNREHRDHVILYKCEN